MGKDSFLYLCDKLCPIIVRQDTRFRRHISVEQRVATTLWCLVTCCEYQTIAHLFGISRSNVCVIVHDMSCYCEYTIDPLHKFPVGESLERVVDGFQRWWGFPQCAGAIDGSHISVAAPELNITDYYNRKGWYSIII